MTTLYLYPSAEGDETNCEQYPASGDNFDKVDDTVGAPDDNATYVASGYDVQRDLYLHEAMERGISVSINYIKIHMRCKQVFQDGGQGTASGWAKTAIKVGGTVYMGSQEALIDGAYSNFYTQYNTNPDTGVAWDASEFADTQIGVQVLGYFIPPAPPTYPAATWVVSYCTQLYLEVDYNPFAFGHIV